MTQSETYISMNIFRHIVMACIVMSMLLGATPTVSAQRQARVQNRTAQQLDRKEWFQKVRGYKHEFLIKELDLTQEQQQKFFPLYDAMEDQIIKLQDDIRTIERNILRGGASVTDAEYEKAVQSQFELKQREAQIELQYLPKFKKVLTPRQLFKLKGVDRKFTRGVMRTHSEHMRK